MEKSEDDIELYLIKSLYEQHIYNGMEKYFNKESLLNLVYNTLRIQ